jgi:DNA-binding transcriptional regulator/RsmH inhibitor MraZ
MMNAKQRNALLVEIKRQKKKMSQAKMGSEERRKLQAIIRAMELSLDLDSQHREASPYE